MEKILILEKSKKLKNLREKTGMPINECNKALIEADFNLEYAEIILKEKAKVLGRSLLNKKKKSGIFGTYIHRGGTLLGIVELLCETDFVARTQEFKELAQDLAAQVLFSENIIYTSDESISGVCYPEKSNEFFLLPEYNIYEREEFLNKIVLLRQSFYKDSSLDIKSLLDVYSAKFREELEIADFHRFEIK
jgi:elongation factor Ts